MEAWRFTTTSYTNDCLGLFAYKVVSQRLNLDDGDCASIISASRCTGIEIIILYHTFNAYFDVSNLLCSILYCQIVSSDDPTIHFVIIYVGTTIKSRLLRRMRIKIESCRSEHALQVPHYLIIVICCCLSYPLGLNSFWANICACAHRQYNT